MPKQSNTSIKIVSGMKYVGDGFGFLMGVPARDLTLDDWNQLYPEQQREVLNSKLYEPITEPIKAPVKQVADDTHKEQN